MKEFILNNLKIELLNEEIIHIEKKSDKDDLFYGLKNTFLMSNKEELEISEFEVVDNGTYFTLLMNEYFLVLEKGPDLSLNELKIYDKYQTLLYSYQYLENSGELPFPKDTPVIFPLFDNPRISLPSKGYSKESFLNKEKFKVEEDVVDFYLLLSKNDPSKLRKLFISLAGRSELVRFKTLGFWNSRYYKYDEESAKKMILDHQNHNIPLDNMVIDTDWRKAGDRGIGYDINLELFPDMKRFFDFAHSQNIEIMFNDHPEPLEGAKDIFDKKEVEFREEKLTNLLSLGLDYWWYDRNWSTHLITPTSKIKVETFGDYLFFDITKNYFKKVSNNDDIYRRPIIMCNVNNVLNGYYESIYDSASHRYSIQWTGDIDSSLQSLGQEVSNLIKGSNNLVTYINSDIGGHIGNPSKEEYIRWMQLGTFEPIFRVHCTNCVIRFREPWNYDEETLDISRKYINLRYRLLPLIYSSLANNYFEGEPIIKALEYNYSDEKCKNNFKDFLFLDNFLVSPFSLPFPVRLSEEDYVGEVEGRFYDNPEVKGKYKNKATFKTLDLVFEDGVPPFKNMSPYEWSAIFTFKLKFKENTSLYISTDDGSTVYIDGKMVHDDQSSHALSTFQLVTLKKNKVYDIKVKFYQHGGMAAINLSKLKEETTKKTVYLPSDTWIDLFSGKLYQGERTLTIKDDDLLKMPLYLKEGSLIYLVKEQNNVEKLDYSSLILDYYPSLINSDSKVLYEDDKTTTAYKLNKFRKTYLESYFNQENSSIIIDISKATGEYEDEIKERDITFKYNLIKGKDKVKAIYLNDKKVEDYKIYSKDSSLMPLSFSNSSNIFKTLVFNFKEKLDEEYQIRIELDLD